MTGLLVHTTGTIRASVALLPLLRSENNPLSAESGSFYVDFTLFLLGFTFGISLHSCFCCFVTSRAQERDLEKEARM